MEADILRSQACADERRRWCEEAEWRGERRASPQPKCLCRGCYRARCDDIPQELLRWLNEPQTNVWSVGTTKGLVRSAFGTYCYTGEITLPEMWAGLIKALAEQNEELLGRQLKLVSLSMKPPFQVDGSR